MIQNALGERLSLWKRKEMQEGGKKPDGDAGHCVFFTQRHETDSQFIVGGQCLIQVET
jgi:hypothetical protein